MHLRDERLGVGHLLKLVLNVHLKMQNFVSVVRMVDLICHLGGFLVQASLKEGLGVVEPVLDHVGVEFCELVIDFGSAGVVLDEELGVGQQGESSAISWRKLEFI